MSSLKLALNTPIYARLTEDMDLKCGETLDGTQTVEGMERLILQAMLDAASGQRTKSGLLGLGDLEFVPWQIGIMS